MVPRQDLDLNSLATPASSTHVSQAGKQDPPRRRVDSRRLQAPCRGEGLLVSQPDLSSQISHGRQGGPEIEKAARERCLERQVTRKGEVTGHTKRRNEKLQEEEKKDDAETNMSGTPRGGQCVPSFKTPQQAFLAPAASSKMESEARWVGLDPPSADHLSVLTTGKSNVL